MKILMILLATLPLAVSQAETELQWKFTPGESHDYRLTQTAHLESGTEKDAKQIADVAEQIDFTWKVVEVDAGGTATISIQVNSYSMTAKGPDGQEVAYDSQSEDDPLGYAAMLLPIGRRLNEEAVKFTMTPQGEVKLLDLPTDLAEAVKSVPGGKLFAKDGGAASFESLARLGGPRTLPVSEVQEGSSWKESLEMEIPALGMASVEFEYEVSELQEDKLVAIKQQMSLAPQSGEADSTWSLGSQNSTGEVQFDVGAGRPENSSLNYKAELTSDSSDPMVLEQNVDFISLSDASQ